MKFKNKQNKSVMKTWKWFLWEGERENSLERGAKELSGVIEMFPVLFGVVDNGCTIVKTPQIGHWSVFYWM